MKRLFLITLVLFFSAGVQGDIIEVPHVVNAGMLIGSGAGGGAGPAYLFEEGFETGVDSPPTGWTEEDNSGGTNDIWNCSTGNCPLTGSYSYRSPDPVSGQNKVKLDFGSVAEVWVAFQVYIETAADQNTSVFRFRDTTDSDVVEFEWYGVEDTLRVEAAYGFSVSSTTATALTSGLYYVKLRVKTGTGNNAEAEAWVTNNTTSWGTGVSSTDGDITNNLRYLILNNYYASDKSYIVDKLVVDNEDIPISYYQ